MILDTAVFISVDRDDRASRQLPVMARLDGDDFHTSEAVVAQVWRGGGPQQARLARFLRTVEVHPLDDGRAVGALLRDAGTADVVDAHVALLGQRLHEEILTSDVDDLDRLTAPMDRPPRVIPWPPPR